VIPLSNVLKEMATFNLWFIDVAQSAYGDLIFSTEDSNLKVITNGISVLSVKSVGPCIYSTHILLHILLKNLIIYNYSNYMPAVG
jgi:hypothetical protein